MHILFLSRWLPEPPNNGSKLRVFNLLRGLAEKHEVTLLSFAEPDEITHITHNMCSFCRDVHVVPWKQYDRMSVRSKYAFINPKPRSVVDTFSKEMVRCIANSLTTQNHDLVIASQLDMAGYVPFFRGLPAVFEEAELSTLYEQYTRSSSPWSRLRYGLTWLKHKRYLAYLLRGFRACTVVSEPERNLLTRSIPNYQHIETIPNCVNMELYDPVPKTSRPNSLIFTGSFRYDANYHAAQWFVSEIYPLIQVQIPEVRLTITGDHASLPLPSCTNLTLTGFVEDVKPLISSATVSVVPILEGGGTRLKILEAMALKTPVVTTTKGCEGLDICNTEHALIADTPAEFALAVIRLLKEPDLRDQLTKRAYGLVHSKYNWTSVMPRFVSFIEEVAKESSGMPSVLSKTQYLSTNPLK